MSTEIIFRVITLVSLAGVFGISGYFRRRADRQGGRLDDQRGNRLVLGLRLYVLAMLLPLGLYLLNPAWAAWARFAVPEWARWLAALTALSLIPAAYWVFTSLGHNISPTAATRQGASLVTHGPYRWVRHPLYTTGMLLFAALTVLTGLWWLAAAALPAVTVIVARTTEEEARLTAAFGEAYRQYMRRTGRFLPRLGAAPEVR